MKQFEDILELKLMEKLAMLEPVDFKSLIQVPTMTPQKPTQNAEKVATSLCAGLSDFEFKQGDAQIPRQHVQDFFRDIIIAMPQYVYEVLSNPHSGENKIARDSLVSGITRLIAKSYDLIRVSHYAHDLD